MCKVQTSDEQHCPQETKVSAAEAWEFSVSRVTFITKNWITEHLKLPKIETTEQSVLHIITTLSAANEHILFL